MDQAGLFDKQVTVVRRRGVGGSRAYLVQHAERLGTVLIFASILLLLFCLLVGCVVKAFMCIFEEN